ncbi:tumor necrosis factor receptor superfamily member 1B [Paramisgurnus dabryanus]|uniref:tumor necrosis factor receptor superfamily member 1B n=1 Tax=Paramisgurnus dabryanus TaxID=90735 RepID=UPI0031F3B675
MKNRRMILIALFLTAVLRVSAGKASPPYRPNGECNNSTSEYYVKETQLCCSKCKPGTRLGTKCTNDQDTVCLPCPDGQFLEKMNYNTNCFSCRKCDENKGLIINRICSADTNADCICKPGMYCAEPGSASGCSHCKKHKICKPGDGVVQHGTHLTNVKCGPCPKGTFSSDSDAKLCKPHRRCEGSSVLIPGSSTADTQCGTPLTTSTQTTKKIPRNLPTVKPRGPPIRTQAVPHITTSRSLPPSSTVTLINRTLPVPKPTSDDYSMTFIYCTGIVVVLVVLILTVIVTGIIYKNRKGNKGSVNVEADSNKSEQSPSANDTPEHQRLIPVDKCQKEPSMTSSDSQSQPDSSQSHISGDWLERTSQEESLPEQPSISSPLVNVSITTTFNCHLNPTTATCSIPVSPSALTPHSVTSVPLSQEEVCISCQQEDGKEALQSVQESSPCAF